MSDERIQINVHKDVLKPIALFDQYYAEAVKNKYIRKPISWALYHAWKTMDEKEKERDVAWQD